MAPAQPGRSKYIPHKPQQAPKKIKIRLNRPYESSLGLLGDLTPYCDPDVFLIGSSSLGSLGVLRASKTGPQVAGTNSLGQRIMCSSLSSRMHMYAHVYIYIYVYMYVHVYIHKYLHIFTCMCVYLYVYLTLSLVCIYWTHIYMYTYVCMGM